MKFIKYLFLLLTVLFFTYVIAGQLILPGDKLDNRNLCEEYNGEWYSVNEDGSCTLIGLPGKIGHNYIIETTIPEGLNENITSLCIRSQDLKAYLDGEMIYSYSTRDNRWFGVTSPESYINIPINRDDAGKVLRIESLSDSGILYQPYIGSELGIWVYIIKMYAGELAAAAITLIMGGLTVIISKIFGIVKKKNMDITYLGLGVFLAALWIITNSVLRQIIFPNLSIADDTPFLMVMLLPFPFIIFMDKIQSERYSKLYFGSEIIMAAIDIICCSLYIAGVCELVNVFMYVALGCLLSIETVVVTFVIDMVKGRIKEYKYVAIGLFGAIISATAQLLIYFNRTGIFRGTILAAGLLFLLCGAAIHTVNNLFSIERDKTAAVLANEAKGKFLAKMSHEIRTPINAVLGMDEMILRESRELAIREYALDIQSAGKSLLSIINDILDISKIESGKMEIIPVEYDFSSMIHDTVNMISIKAKGKTLELVTEVDENLPSRLIGDDIRIRQILINLLNNAVKYTEKGSVTLAVSGQTNGEEITLHFEVRDTGIGIKKEDLPKLYEQFTRIEEARNRNIEGSGLGMSITVQLLGLMGSHIDVSSVYGEGSCFYFDLKQGVKDKTPIGNLSERIKEQEQEYQFKTGVMAPEADILVVDDNAVNRKVVRNLLKGTLIRIDEADSGEQCLEKVVNKKYDMIFLDHMMPGLDGIETLHAMKTLEGNMNNGVPVIALTANAVTGAKEMYLSEGFDAFLSKPIMYTKLEKMIIQYLPEEKIVEGSMEEDAPQTAGSDSPEINELLEKIPEINLEYAYMHNNSPEALYDIMVDFAKLIDSDADALENFRSKLPDEEALKQYRVKVHSMKASAAMIGAMSISGVARMLEVAAINGNIDVIEQVTPAFLSEWKSYKDKLSPITEREKMLKNDSLVDVNMDIVKMQLDMLNEAMQNMDIDKADEIVELLKEFVYPKELNSIMEKLYEAVSNIDDVKVAGLTKEIISH